ncbi:hypothetical protein KCU67_g16978, partial [Aureobasidium melanogenum]
MISSSNKEDDRPLPDQILAVAPQPLFTFSVVPLRKMAVANSSTKMARLNANLEAVGGNTHVETPQKWKERGLEGEAIAELTRGEGDPCLRQLLRSQCLRKISSISALPMPELL